MYVVLLLGLGLILGSFVNALVWRLHQQSLPSKKRAAKLDELSIGRGRSMCVNCGHTLRAIDLIPVVSWLSLGGKCRYCRAPISRQYPLVEIGTALLFVISYAFWPERIVGIEILAFGLWLVCLVGFMALVVYDLRWMILPNRIVFPLYFVAAAFVIVNAAQKMSPEPILGSVLGVLVGGGIFYVLFQVSDGKWIGGGDVKLGFLLGGLLGSPLSAALMLFIASLLGTIMVIPQLLAGKTSRGTRIPFGPFLIAGAVLVQLVGTPLIDWYLNLVLM